MNQYHNLQSFDQNTQKLNAVLHGAGYKNFNGNNRWESCFCDIVTQLKSTVNLVQLINVLPVEKSPMGEVSFLNAMAHLGFYGRKIKCDPDKIDPRILPALFITHKGVPHVIKGHREGGAHSDLKGGRGHIWIFHPYDDSRQATSKFRRQGSGHSWFRALLGRFKHSFFQILSAGLVINLIALMAPLYIMLIYDRIIAAGTLEPLPVLAFGAVLAIVFEWCLRDVRSKGLSWLSGRLDNIVSNKILSHLIALPPSLIERASVAAQVARIKTFETVRDFFSGAAFLSLLEAPFVVIALAALGFIAGPLIFIPIVIVIAYVVIFALVHNQVKSAIRIAAKSSSARQQFTIETFEKIEGIRATGLGQKWADKFRHLSGREMMGHFQLGWLGMVAETMANALTVLAAVSTIGFGVHLIWAGTMTTGALGASMILVWRILTPFYSLCTMIPRLEQLRNSIIQVNDLMDIDTEEEIAKSRSRLPRIRGRISFDNVAFKYDDGDDTVFSRLSFDIKPGEMIALTGQSGTGKSIALSLIKSLYKPTQGAVFIDGFDVRQLDAPSLRQQIAYVPKTAKCFHGSILENIRYTNPAATEKDVEKALRLADAWDDVMNLANGVYTVVGGSLNEKISPSLEMRISLARAYLHPGKIILIDAMPNMLLSTPAGENLKEYLSRVRGNRTILMITYRNDFLKMADRVVLMRPQQDALIAPPEKIQPVLERTL